MKDLQKRNELIYSMFMVSLMAVLPDVAAAGALDGWGTALLNILNNGFIQTIATIVVIIFFFGALLNQISWKWAAIIIFAISGAFSAQKIVTLFRSVTIG
jgi:type IV secretory pathway VirB2 component (pilin)